MNTEKKGNPSQAAKLGPEEICSKARGEISKAAFTNGEAGPFSKEYLSGESIYERLNVGEVAHYILVNKSEGVILHPIVGGHSESLAFDSGYRSVMIVTDRRILFMLGGEEDTIVEISPEDVTEADFQSSPWKKQVRVSTQSEQYEFTVSIQDSSDHEDAVKYIQEKPVPNTPTMDRSSGSTTGEQDRTDLIEEIHRLDREFNGEVGVSHVRKHCRYPVSAYLQEFGSWRETFKLAIQAESEQAPQDDVDVDSTSEHNEDPRNQERRSEEGVEASEEDVIAAVEQVSTQLEKRPTTSEFSKHSSLELSDVYRHFDSWGDVLGVASLDTLSRQALLNEIQRLSAELGYPPLSAHVNDHTEFSVYDYRQEFGSVTEAVEEAGLSVEDRVRDTLRELVAESDDNPKMADFEARSDYSAGVIYKFFDSWDDALSGVSPAEDQSKTGLEPQSDSTGKVVQNELSERYELVRYLQKLCLAVLDIRQEQISEKDGTSPMERWVNKVSEFWKGEATEAQGYGAQHAERNPFSMQEYREAFGDGEWVTEFDSVRAHWPSPTLEAIYKELLDDTPSEVYLPADEQTGDAFPVIVDTEKELSQANKMLDRLPEEPVSADPDIGTESEFKWTGEEVPNATTDPEKIQDVNGVTDTIEQSLLDSGFHTRSALKEASLDELTQIDGISDQIAMRIKLDVGG